MYVHIQSLKSVACINFKAVATVTIMIKVNFCRLYLKCVLDFGNIGICLFFVLFLSIKLVFKKFKKLKNQQYI